MAGVVLCGGDSTRMGFDKARLEVEGRPIIEVLAERLAEVCAEVMLATGDPGRLGPLAYPEVADAVPHAGPLAGLVAALRATDHELLAVVAVDMPAANPVLLRYLGDRAPGHDAAVPVGPQGAEPLHAVYARSALASLERRVHSRRRGLRGALEELDVLLVGEGELLRAGFGTSFAANVNDLDDLWMLRPPGRSEA